MLPVPLRRFAYRAFARVVGANLAEAELELGAYPSLGEFFARRLRQGSRVVDQSPHVIVSPCDGVIAARGTVNHGAMIQAKGRMYSLAELLADGSLAARFEGGAYATIYLSPRDYHRVHAPVAAQLRAYEYLPGALWPVNPHVAARRDGLLARNERAVIHMQADRLGAIALVMVGAAGVGNIALAYGPDSASLRRRGERRRIELDDRLVARGDELGSFRLGSTVVVVFEAGKVELDGWVAGQGVRFGEPLGRAFVANGSAS